MCYSNVSSISNNNNNNINSSKQIMSNNSNSNNIINSNSIKDNFRTPLTPLHRGDLGGLHMGGLGRPHMWDRERPHKCGRVEFYKECLGGLHKLRLEGFYNGIIDRVYKVCVLKNAFSLIELSIVLIIIGLLVAGVTGGKSLIENARSRALINELREYERAVWTFRAARDRWPGDRDNLGKFGSGSKYMYSKTDFSAPFDTGNFTPSYSSAPFIDLYTEGIIDFKPLGNSTTADKNSTTKGTPNSKVIDNTYLGFTYIGETSLYEGTSKPNTEYRIGLKNFGNIEEVLIYTNTANDINPKILKQVDLKLDDGEHWNGRVRSSCYGKKSDGTTSDTTAGFTDYDYAIENNKKCKNIYYAL